MFEKDREIPEKERKDRKRVIFIIILIILILLTLYQCGHSPNHPELGPGVIIGAGVKEGERDRNDHRQEVKPNGKAEMTVRINGYPVFASGGSEGNLNIENPVANELHMNVEITLNETGEVIYNSGAIPPNHYIDNGQLSKNLEKGAYEATAHVTLFDPEYPDNSYNSANFTLVITVKN